jgi:light-regulated signal transduction histidine kinase (bacteriophytochrome)
MRLSPRKSFELWQEEVKYKSLPWRKSELNAASGFAYALQKHINLQYVQRQEEQYRKLNEELLAANKELSNINWISTHDLREPLRKIRIFASKILEQGHPGLDPDVRNSVERMQAAALKMQQLIEDIFSYAQTSSMEQVFSSLDLEAAWTHTLQELAQDIDARGAQITADPLPVIRAIPFQARQLLVNLLSNALKFAREGVRPEIHLSCSVVSGSVAGSDKLSRDASCYQLILSDNGVGFEPKYATRIFEVFQRLHPSHTFRGTGIGLAICKKIMENHHGLISAEGVPGAGARFYLYFPVGDVKA